MSVVFDEQVKESNGHVVDSEKEAFQKIEEARKERVKKALDEIKQICQKYRVDLRPIIYIIPDSFPRAELQVIPQP